jgi:hypothetical protein
MRLEVCDRGAKRSLFVSWRRWEGVRFLEDSSDRAQCAAAPAFTALYGLASDVGVPRRPADRRLKSSAGLRVNWAA